MEVRIEAIRGGCGGHAVVIMRGGMEVAREVYSTYIVAKDRAMGLYRKDPLHVRILR